MRSADRRDRLVATDLRNSPVALRSGESGLSALGREVWFSMTGVRGGNWSSSVEGGRSVLGMSGGGEDVFCVGGCGEAVFCAGGCGEAVFCAGGCGEAGSIESILTFTSIVS